MSCKGWSSSSSPKLSPVFKTYTWTLSPMCESRAISGCRKMLPVSKKHRSMRHMSRIMFRMLWKKSTPSTFPLARLDKDRGKNDWSPDVQQTNVWVRGYRFMTNCLGLNQRPASVRTVLVPKDLILQQQKMSEKLRDRLREREGKKTKHQKRVSSLKYEGKRNKRMVKFKSKISTSRTRSPTFKLNLFRSKHLTRPRSGDGRSLGRPWGHRWPSWHVVMRRWKM